ncbi:MAG: ABC transporter substrate-binding protein, partial [Desulfarculus sp.]|nr:ABC transporter substrate-binding protein [Desulfarculus sp.]
MKRPKWMVWSVALSLLLLCAVGAQAAEAIKVGIVLPLTGTEAQFGEIEWNSFQLALDEINGAGGVKGRPIELVKE